MRLLLFGILLLVVSLPVGYTEESAAATELNNQAIQEAQAGHLTEAVSLLRQAWELAPSDSKIRSNFSQALTDQALALRRSGRTEQAVKLFRESVQVDAANGRAWIELGNLCYLELNDFDQAIDCWKQARGLVPASHWQAVSERLSQAERDRMIERRFAAYPTEHFQIRFPGPEYEEMAVRIGQWLETEYDLFSKELGVSPRPTVILYGGKDFERLSARRDWSIGFYDGRIRIRIEDIGTPYEPQILSHELAHAFLHEAYGNRIPTWLHEGYAQLKEPPRMLSPREKELESRLVSGTAWIPLKWLDSRFEQPSNTEDVGRAYMESRIVAQFLINAHGMERFKEFLERLASGESMEGAFDASFSPSRWSRVEQGILETPR